MILVEDNSIERGRESRRAAAPPDSERGSAMAEKDILEKSLLSYEDVFTDCINMLVFS